MGERPLNKEPNKRQRIQQEAKQSYAKMASIHLLS